METGVHNQALLAAVSQVLAGERDTLMIPSAGWTAEDFEKLMRVLERMPGTATKDIRFALSERVLVEIE